MYADGIELRLDLLHRGPALCDRIHQRLKFVGILGVDIAIGIAQLYGNAQVGQRACAASGQIELPGNAVDLVRPDHHVKREVKVGGAARERPDDRDVRINVSIGQRLAFRRDPELGRGPI